MKSFKDLPDELLVKIFACLSDNNPTKYRLERVSKRFNRCLQDSWKYSAKSLYFGSFTNHRDEVSLEFAAAFMQRVPEVTHLRLSPDITTEQKQLLYQNASKLRVIMFEFSSEHAHNCNEANTDLMVWCLHTCREKLNCFYFQCSSQYHIGRCFFWEAAMGILPDCPKLQELHLFNLKHIAFSNPRGTVFKGLRKLNLNSLTLDHCSGAVLSIEELVELLNERPVNTLKIVRDEEPYDDYNDFDSIQEFCQHLNKSAAGELNKLTVEPTYYWEHLEFMGKILDYLPSLNNFTTRSGWYSCDDESDDPQHLAQTIEQFICRGIQKQSETVFDLTIDREEQDGIKECYHFGTTLLELVTKMGAETRNVDVNNWKAKIVRDNVAVRISTVINGLN